MTRLPKLVCFGLFAIGAMPLCAQDDVCRQLSVSELFRLAEQTYSTKGNRILEQSAQELSEAAKSEQLPDIQFGAEAAYRGQSVYVTGPHWQQSYGLELSQPLYHGGRIRQNVRLASIKQETARLQSAASEADLRLELLGHYCSLLSLWEQKKVRLKNIEESQRRYNDVGNMYRKGIVTRNDLIRSSLQLSQDSLDYRTVNNDITIVSYRLATILGLESSRLIMPDTTLTSRPQQTDSLLPMEAYIRLAYEKHPDLLIARQRIKQSETELKITQAHNLPSLNLVAGYSLNRPNTRTFENLYLNNWHIGLNLSHTFSSLYKNNHNINSKRQDVLYCLNEEYKKVQELAIRINNCYVDYRETWDNISTLRHSVRQASENYRIVSNRYRNQLSIFTDLLDASNVLLEAELQLTVAYVESIYSYYKLMHACGNL